LLKLNETYIGGKLKGKGVLAGKRNKQVVVGIRERKGPLRFIHAADAKAITLKAVIDQHVSADVEYYMTDESTSLNSVLRKTGKHQIVNHTRGEYVRGIVHTNTIESAFGLFKRGIVGQFHKVSIKHLQRYLDEFTYRFDRRNDGDVFIQTVRRLCGFKPLRFAELTSDPEAASVPF
jgi:transposase-like protein